MILFSCLFWRLAADGETLQAALAIVTLVVSLAVSQVRAEAEAAGVTLSDGLFQRLERVLALIVGLMIPGAMLPVLVILSVLGVITVGQRASAALKGA
jgi:CDP-diacylglycerol---glycerol-3-phosphate 3-phosphatidyltransferase